MEIDIPDFDDIKFEDLCDACGGHKIREQWDYPPRERDARGRLKPWKGIRTEVPCDRCDSDGMVPTTLGDRLLEFLAKQQFKAS